MRCNKQPRVWPVVYPVTETRRTRALALAALDGLTRTYGARYPKDAEPFTKDFTAWLMSIGLELEERALGNGDEDEDENEQDDERDDNR